MFFDLFTPRRKTWLMDVNPAVKFVIFLALFLLIFFSKNNTLIFYLMIAATLLLLLFSGHGVKRLLLFSIPIALAFLSTTVTMLFFGRGDLVLWQWGIFKISEESISFALLLGFKTISLGFLSLTFLLTTRPMILFYALMQHLKLPAKYAYSFIAALSIVPIIVEEWQDRSNALKVRGVTYARGLRGAFQRLRLYAVPLFAQSIRRAQRIAVAMEAKQFQMTEERTYYYVTTFSRADVFFTLLMTIVTAVAISLS